MCNSLEDIAFFNQSTTNRAKAAAASPYFTREFDFFLFFSGRFELSYSLE